MRLRCCPYPISKRTYYVAVDASATGLGAVLYQLHVSTAADSVKNRRWVVFAARALHMAERNYSATKRELLAIVFALRRFHFYIWGKHFNLYSDHRSLTFLLTQKYLSPMMAGWMETILAYTFSIFHRPGVLNILPDRLSRLYPAALLNPATTVSVFSNEQDPTIPIVSEELRANAIESAHLQGHFGIQATLATLVSRKLWWPRMRSDVEAAIKSCIPCQRWTITQQGFRPLIFVNST